MPSFISHVRSFENFSSDNASQGFSIPPVCGPDCWVPDTPRATLMGYFFFASGRGMWHLLVLCLSLGFLRGTINTLFYQIIKWQTYIHDHAAFAEGILTPKEALFYDSVGQTVTAQAVSALISSFKFFPAFLQLGYIRYAVSHWRDFQKMGYFIQGSRNSCSLAIGGCLANAEPDCKKMACSIYRYYHPGMQVVHLLAYHQPMSW